MAAEWLRRGVRGCCAGLRRAGPVLLIATGVVLGLMLLDRAMAVRAWQVRCDDPVLQRAVSRRLQEMAPLGFVAGMPGRVAERLRRLEPDIDTIEVERRLPHLLRIRAEVRRPVALWSGGDGRVMLVDGAGVPYRPLRRGELQDLPLLRTRDRGCLPRLTALLQRVRRLDPRRLAGMSELIVRDDGQLRINLSRGAQWRLPLDGAAPRRVERIMELLDEPRWRHGHWRVDARQRDRWYLRAGYGDRAVI